MRVTVEKKASIHMAPMEPKAEDFAVTQNACKLCTPLGAVLAFSGVRGAMTVLHGSQGCATYIRRYLISHFREPLDVASSSFTEHSAVFGGTAQLQAAITNLWVQYKPELIAVATTCLAETIGEDVPGILKGWSPPPGDLGPRVVHVSTASYRGTHRQGFQAAVLALARSLVVARSTEGGPTQVPQARPVVNVFPGMVSPADLRWIKATVGAMGIKSTLVPDYSQTLDGGLWDSWNPIPPGGTTMDDIQAMASSTASISIGTVAGERAGEWLQTTHGVTERALELPIGILLTDLWYDALSCITGGDAPAEALEARARLADSYADAHKYVAGVQVLIYGEEDMVVGLASWVAETGMVPLVCATGAKAPGFDQRLKSVVPHWERDRCLAVDRADFIDIEALAREKGIRLVLGNSKGYKLARAMDVPMVRVGFPVHDRFGGQRIGHLGYEAAQTLFDRVVNTLLEREQDRNPVGYTYF